MKSIDKKRLQKLAERVVNGTATEAEKRFLDEYYNLFDSEKNTGNNLSPQDEDDVYNQVEQQLSFTANNPKSHRSAFYYLSRMAAAALVFTAVILSIYKIHQKLKPLIAKAAPHNQPIVHGSNKATLTLDNGATIELDDKSTGRLADDGHVKISKNKKGEIEYTTEVREGAQLAVNKFNTLRTPRGGIFQVNLPDGTRVWLNSSTSLKYPVVFTGGERKVELDGEAYFEVAHNKDMPFLVVSKTQAVQVLGTHFNINSYQDEDYAKTTLLEGSVRVSLPNETKPVLLVPGQQSVAKPTGIKVRRVDLDNTVSWKNGLFQFDNEDIHSIMKKISRWYDVDVEYESGIEHMRFGGLVSRYADISQVLHKLELTKTIHFKIEGRRILVMK